MLYQILVSLSLLTAFRVQLSVETEGNKLLFLVSSLDSRVAEVVEARKRHFPKGQDLSERKDHQHILSRIAIAIAFALSTNSDSDRERHLNPPSGKLELPEPSSVN